MLLAFKIPFLALVLLYAIFTFIVVSRIKALNRLVYISASRTSDIIRLVALIQFFMALSLFFITLVIV